MDFIRKAKGIDAVITDIHMPEMDGIELVEQIHSDKENRRIAIIVNTQYGDSEQEERIIALDTNNFVYKPSTPKIVEISVRNVLRAI